MVSYRIFPLWIRTLSLLICISVLALPIMVQAQINDSMAQQQEEQDYQMICAQAEEDAQRDEGGATGYMLGGCLCGVFGFLIAYGSSPKAPSDRLVGKDPNYVHAYSKCYEQKAKKIRTSAACTGWLVGSAVSFAILFSGGTE